MKTKLLFIVFLIFAFTANAQTTIETSMGAGYANQVFYKLGTETETSFTANSWDLAFLRISSYNFNISVNAHLGINVYEASDNIADWENIDVVDEASWGAPLYNSDTEWSGAFMQGSAGYGFGEYNSATHHVEGSIIFVLKYVDGSYIKFINEDYYGGYTFKYATWNGSEWSADQTTTIPNTSNPDNQYNYYSLQNNEEVLAEPAIGDWDFQFTKYFADVTGAGDMYLVTGVLHSGEITVAQNTGDSADYDSLSYASEINTIGYDWKTYGDGGYAVDENQKYYVKYADGTIYKMYFTAYDGMETGDITFVLEGQNLGSEDVVDAISFGIFPNPTIGKKINIVYDVKSENLTDNSISIYDLNGREVYNTTIPSGFYNREINLDNLNTGIYLVQFRAGENSTTKKLVLQ